MESIAGDLPECPSFPSPKITDRPLYRRAAREETPSRGRITHESSQPEKVQRQQALTRQATSGQYIAHRRAATPALDLSRMIAAQASVAEHHSIHRIQLNWRDHLSPRDGIMCNQRTDSALPQERSSRTARFPVRCSARRAAGLTVARTSGVLAKMAFTSPFADSLTPPQRSLRSEILADERPFPVGGF